MTRAARTYSDRAAHAPVAGAAGVPAWPPVAGFYRYRLRSGGVAVGVRIWFGPPHDPLTGEEMDRSWRWQAEVNGRPIDLDRVWPTGAGEPIDAREYEHLSSLQTWGEQNAPHSPEANPNKPVNWLTAPLTI